MSHLTNQRSVQQSTARTIRLLAKGANRLLAVAATVVVLVAFGPVILLLHGCKLFHEWQFEADRTHAGDDLS